MPAEGRREPDLATLDAMLRPRSVAVVGASDDPARIGGRPIAYMQARGFAGPLLPVNPKRDRVQGLPAYPSVADLPLAPDVAVVAVPADAALEAVEALGARGCRAVVMFTAGFAETGEAGALLQARLVAAARAHGMRLLGPNCLGAFNAAAEYYATFSASFEAGWPLPGGIGIASQSGAFGTHLYSVARERRIGTPVLVTTGNEAEVALADALAWMAAAPEVEVICAYAEGIREGGRFLAALELARRNRKPVVMMKVGRSALGQRAAQSHTASIAGDDAVTEAVLREFGVHRVRDVDELLDVAYAATRRIYPVGNTLGVLTLSGGAGVMMSDAAEALGLAMPPMPEEAEAALRGLVPFAATGNPVDCTAQVFNDLSLVGRFAEAVAAEGGYRSLLAFFTQVGGSGGLAPRIQAELAAVRARHPDRLWAVSVIAPPERAAAWEADGFLVFEDPTRAVTALAAMGGFGEAFAAPPPAPVALPDVALPEAAPDEAEAKALLAAAGIPAVPERVARDAGEAVAFAVALGYPVVLKLLSPDILHKSEIGGVLLGLADAAAVREGVATLLARAARQAPEARIRGVLVARQVTGAVEMAMGVLRDPVFGPVAMVGLGGVFVEVLQDVAFRRCPFDAAEAERPVRSLRGFALLDGARGRPKADVAALARALAALSAFAVAAGPRLRSAEVNPLLVLPEGQGCLAADAAIELEAG